MPLGRGKPLPDGNPNPKPLPDGNPNWLPDGAGKPPDGNDPDGNGKPLPVGKDPLAVLSIGPPGLAPLEAAAVSSALFRGRRAGAATANAARPEMIVKLFIVL